MSNRRRIILIILSVSIGMGLSVLLFYFRNSGKPLSSQDFLWLGTNLFFSLLIVAGIGYYLMRKNKKEEEE